METGMVITTVILITLCISPFILIYVSTKQKDKKLKNKFVNAVAKNNGTLTDFTLNTEYAIGLDENAMQIYFYNITFETDNLQSIKLKDVRRCEIKKETKRIKSGKSNFAEIQNIALIFIGANGKKIGEFELYDYDKSPQPNGEVFLADTWKKKVIDLLPICQKFSEDQIIEKSLPSAV